MPFVVKRRFGKDRCRLVFEGRFLSADLSAAFKPFAKNKPTWHVVLEEDWEVAKCSKKSTAIPKNHALPLGTPDVSFAALVLGKSRALLEGLDSVALDPQSQPAAAKLLSDWGESWRVNVNFCVTLSPVKVAVAWIASSDATRPPAFHREDGEVKFLHLEAFTGHGNRIRYRPHVRNVKTGRKKKTRETLPAVPNSTREEECRESNRASGVTVHLTGLSLALKLGLLSADAGETGQAKLERLNSELGLSCAYLWIQRDDLGRVRVVTYYDLLFYPAQSFAISPGFLGEGETGRKGPAKIAEENVRLEEERWEGWKRVLDHVWERRGHLLLHRKRCLQPLLDSWGTKKELGGGTQGRCLASMERFLSRVTLRCFSRDDSSLHALKLFFARYCEEVRGSRRGVYLRTVGGTKIHCLQNSEVEVENVAQFFGGSPSPPLLPDDPEANAIFGAWIDLCPGLPRPAATEMERHPSHFGGCPDREADLYRRGYVFARLLSEVHTAFSGYLCRRFGLDVLTAPFLTLSSLSFRAVMLDFWKKGGPAAHSLEKTKPSWESSIRKLSKGGFSYTSQTLLRSGQDLFDCPGGSEPAVSVVEFDLKSCYGYSLSRMAVPAAFGVGYALESSETPPRDEESPSPSSSSVPELCRLARTDRRNRARSFEYLGVQAVLSAALSGVPEEAVGVWSNFSPLGVWYVGKYPVDLAIAFEGREIFFFQFDGQHAHSCPTGQCRPLARYVNGQEEAAVREATRRRDEFFEFWIRDNNYSGRKLPASYHVVNDCHHPELSLRKLFGMSDLAQLRRAYETLPSKRKLSFPADLLAADPELTYLLIGRGRIPEERREDGMPLLVWKTEESAGGTGVRHSQDFGFDLEDRDYLFTRDTLEHLVGIRGFQFTSVSACCFYKKCRVLPEVFSGLVAERQESAAAGNGTLANFLKCAVNFSTGMFGLKNVADGGSGSGGPSRTRLTSKITWDYTRCLESVEVKAAGSVAGKSFYVARRLAPRKRIAAPGGGSPAARVAKRRKATDAAIPIYASVVEFGKLRLLECLEFLFDTVRRGAVRVLYSQVDNLVLALSADDLEGVVYEARRAYFDFARDAFFGDSPGKLDEKWKVSTASPLASGAASWQFASARVCSYGLEVRDAEGTPLSGHAKMSGLVGVSSGDAFESNRRLLQGLPGLSFEQERRTNSLLNEDTVLRIIGQLRPAAFPRSAFSSSEVEKEVRESSKH